MVVNEPAASANVLLASLVGERIQRVTYREIKYDRSAPHYREPDHHSLDYGVELHLGSTRVVSFTWKFPVAYYLGIADSDLSAEITGEHAIWDVSAEPPWPSLVGRPITRAFLQWFNTPEAPGDFPFTVKLEFDPFASLHITLGVSDEADDHLAILFSDDAARAHGRFVAASGVRAETR